MKIYWCTTCLVVVVLLGVMTNAQDLGNMQPPKPWTQKPNWPNFPTNRPTQKPIKPWTQKPNWPNFPTIPVTQKPWTQKPNWPNFPTIPATQKPWTQKPWTQKPWTQKPWTQKPWTQKPWTQKPNWPNFPTDRPTQKPVKPWTQKPNWPNFPTIPPTQKPVKPWTQKPNWPNFPTIPATQKPWTQKPWTQKPWTQKPWTQKPDWPTTPQTPIGNWVPSTNEIVETNLTPPTPLTCDVDPSVRITCGYLITSAQKCSAINCCFDGQKCYYGKMVTVQATKAGSFVVVVSRQATLPTLDLNSVRLRNNADPRCQPVAYNSAFIVFFFPVQSCGTTVSESTGVIIYDNSLVSSYEITNGPHGSITRDSYFSLVFQARYRGLYVETLMVRILSKKDPLDVIEEGPISVELRLANGVCSAKTGCVDENMYYSSYYAMSAYPISIVLREPVYVEVRILDKTDPGMVLLLNRCWATNGPQPHSMPQWDLLINGCPNPNDNNKYLTTKVSVANVPLPALYQRFIVKMFTFIEQPTKTHVNTQVYFHCSATVCHSAVSNCQQACQRKRRDVSENPSPPTGVVVSSGAINLIEGTAVELQ